MLNPPTGLTQERLAAALAQGWNLEAAAFEYRPLGFGSHHWETVDAAGARWFVTADELETKLHTSGEALDAGFARLRAALATAQRLRQAGLGFVGAPVPTVAGEAVLRAGERFALALYPFVAGQSFEFGAFPCPEHRRAVFDLLVRLHTAPAAAVRAAAVDDFSIPYLGALTAALDPSRRIAEPGPYTRRATGLVAANAGLVRDLLDHYDGLVRTVRSQAPRLVPTHGEPHPGNTMRGPDGWLLIDWDTALLAPPERDLWRLALEDGSLLADYAEATGVEPLPQALELYRLRWDVADLAAYAAQFTAPHADQPNERSAWGYMSNLMESLATRAAAG